MTQTGEKTFMCEFCDKSFSQSFELKRHTMIHTDERPYKCDICKKAFRFRFSLNEHKRTHTGERPYKCDICNKAFARSKSLKNHHNIHTGDGPHKCDVCDKTFIVSRLLKSHKRTMHTFKCWICKKVFSSCCTVNEHSRTHTLELDTIKELYSCIICNLIFCCNDNLLNHEEAHRNNNLTETYKSFRCSTCEKPFISKSIMNLLEKDNSLSGEDITCDFCEKSFASIDQLKAHEKDHLTKKDFKCDLCKKAFMLSSSLDKHKIVCISSNYIECGDTIKEEIKEEITLDDNPLNVNTDNYKKKVEHIIPVKVEIHEEENHNIVFSIGETDGIVNDVHNLTS